MLTEANGGVVGYLGTCRYPGTDVWATFPGGAQ